MVDFNIGDRAITKDYGLFSGVTGTIIGSRTVNYCKMIPDDGSMLCNGNVVPEHYKTYGIVISAQYLVLLDPPAVSEKELADEYRRLHSDALKIAVKLKALGWELKQQQEGSNYWSSSAYVPYKNQFVRKSREEVI